MAMNKVIIKSLYVFAFLCVFRHVNACDADSIRIMSFVDNPETAFNLSRHDFLEIVKTQNNYIDTLILDKSRIKEFLKLTKNLTYVKDLNVDTNQYDWHTISIATSKGTVPVKIEKNTLNNRMCITIYNKGSKEIMWLSINLIDIHYKRYELSENLKKFLGSFSPLFNNENE